MDEAIAAYKKVIELDPSDVVAHGSLGHALAGAGRLDEAIACYKKAIELDPNHAELHCNLGGALQRQGRFAESLAASQRGHKLRTKQAGWRYPSAAWVRRAEVLAALEAKLPAFLKGEIRPRDTGERVGLISVCRAEKLHAATVRFCIDAFAADPKLAADVQSGLRYDAACNAALAAAGQGKDATKLGETQRRELRRRALTWLRADLTQWARLFAEGDVGRRRLARVVAQWQKDADLAALRDKDALAKLSAEERAACERLWADAAALVKKDKGKAK